MPLLANYRILPISEYLLCLVGTLFMLLGAISLLPWPNRLGSLILYVDPDWYNAINNPKVGGCFIAVWVFLWAFNLPPLLHYWSERLQGRQ